MALTTRLGAAVAALMGRATTAQVVDASAQPYGGVYQTRFDLASMVARDFSIVGICRKFNAQGCADAVVRLYQPASSSSVPRSRKAWLRCTHAGKGPGARAAMYAEHAEEFDEVKSHPVLDLLARPNQNETGTEYAKKHYGYMELTGNSFHAVDLGTRTSEPIGLQCLMPQWVRADAGEKGSGQLVSQWYYGRSRTQEVRIPPEEMIHCKMNPAPGDALWGVGPLHDIAKEADIIAYALQYETALMLNEARPSYVLEFGPGVTEDQAKATMAAIDKRHRGASKAGKVFAAVRDAVIKPLGMTAKEMQYREGIDLLEKRILKAFGIPESLLARSEGTISIGGGGASSAAKSVWLSLTILPRVNAWCDTLNTYLLPMFGVLPGEMWFAADNPDGENENAESARLVLTTNAGITTLNDARAEIGYEPFAPEIGDVPRFSGKGAAALDAPAPNPFGSPFPPADPTEPRGKRHVCGPGCTHTRAAADPENQLYDLAFTSLAKKAKQWLDKNIIAVSESVQLNGSVSIGVEPVATSFTEIVGPSITQYFGKGWDGGAAVINKVKPAAIPAFNVKNKWAIEYAEKTKVQLAPSVAEQLIADGKEAALDTLNETIAGGLKDGLSIKELQQAVADKLGIASDYKAYTIASTESAKAYVSGKVAGWEESGIVKSAKWLLSGDPCPRCIAAYEEWEAMGGVSLSGMAAYGERPGFIHPRCRCDVGISEYHE